MSLQDIGALNMTINQWRHAQIITCNVTSSGILSCWLYSNSVWTSIWGSFLLLQRCSEGSYELQTVQRPTIHVCYTQKVTTVASNNRGTVKQNLYTSVVYCWLSEDLYQLIVSSQKSGQNLMAASVWLQPTSPWWHGDWNQLTSGVLLNH